MRFDRPKSIFSISIAGICGFIWLLMGCTTLGPQYIASGRAAYNEVINHIEDQQMLMAIVRTRYGETISYRNSYYYIDETDQATKQMFRILGPSGRTGLRPQPSFRARRF